ncbi:MAG: hypothetical protein E7478_04490 [Ruminococcaceae bacterium]|nr:hypothetical protein [Oscillospiraceae bacterium]
MQIPGDYNSNLAYDLSRFDVEEQERQNEHRRKEQEKVKQEIRMNSRSVSRSGSRIKLLLGVGLVFAALCAVNFQLTTSDDWARKVTDQQAALTAAQEENSLLQSRLESKVNISYIEEYATTQLGMAKVTNSQIQYLSVNTEDLIEVEPDGGDSLFDGVSRWFGDMLEYIGL